LNLLRCWGGAVVPTDDFYDLCDEAGILVWTEFPLACHRYEGTEKYLAVLDSESRSIISRVRRHACNAIFCGGNELLNNWSMMTDQDLPLRLLNRNCYDLSPQTPFLPASPVMDVMHGGYQFVLPDGRDVFQYGRAGKHIAYCEFGVPGPSPLSRIEEIIPPEQRNLQGLVDDSAWQVRFALQAWDVVRATWLEVDTIEKLLGPPKDLEQLIHWGELLQREGLKALFEEYRRQKPYCSMALNWCFCEPWPTAANNSVVAWPDVPKAGYEGLGQANRAVMASGRIEKFSWQGGEVFRIEPWILNDLYKPVEPGVLQATLRLGEEAIPFGSWPFPQVGENQHVVGREMTCQLPKVEAELFTVELTVQGREEMNSLYTLRYCR
jgi:beta-mannosidase